MLCVLVAACDLLRSEYGICGVYVCSVSVSVHVCWGVCFCVYVYGFVCVRDIFEFHIR